MRGEAVDLWSETWREISLPLAGDEPIGEENVGRPCPSRPALLALREAIGSPRACPAGRLDANLRGVRRPAPPGRFGPAFHADSTLSPGPC